jgi:hypothetical protein
MLVHKVTPKTIARGKITPLLVIETKGIEIASIAVANAQIIAVVPTFAP